MTTALDQLLMGILHSFGMCLPGVHQTVLLSPALLMLQLSRLTRLQRKDVDAGQAVVQNTVLYILLLLHRLLLRMLLLLLRCLAELSHAAGLDSNACVAQLAHIK
jgi:hypothetical protein